MEGKGFRLGWAVVVVEAELDVEVGAGVAAVVDVLD